ncbi:sugar ABC transporter permease [Flintibacter sp. KGMB00164]|uniref:carbohydrate ABC transporter permease n=1 Tax=Flintibacter sp. KGMB00164 TaxID=2610895 RepID=UPI000D789E5D|nr:sugar ABC transporter permease [Flintibacter sp. KGMB00164]
MKKAVSQKKLQARAGMMFLAPSMIIFTLFVFIPLLASFVFSFLETNLMFKNMTFVGFTNYINMFTDDRFWNAFGNTIYYTVCVVPAQVILALLVAVALRHQTKFNNFLKSVYFLPAICSMTVISIVWSFLLNKDISIISYYLSKIGIHMPDLLNSPTLAMPTVIGVGLWKNLGFNMVILVAGLQGIPESYYEAADLDGASSRVKLTHITIPMLMPTLTFVTVNSVISSFQIFDQVYVMTNGGPLFRTETVVQYIYNNAIGKSDIGYASAVAVVMLILTLSVSLVLFKYMRQDEDQLS